MLLLAGGCYLNQKSTENMLPDAANFKSTVDGKETELFILKNSHGMQAAITNYGGRLVSLLVPGKNDVLIPVVVGFDSLSGYIHSSEPYFGATIGRYGNRIANGRFTLDGKLYQLSVNNGPNTLHGGAAGFQYRVWDAEQQGDSVLILTYRSVDGDQGFPGQVSCKVVYTLTDGNELKLNYEATSNKPTVVNLTNHAFFNLNGEGSGDINGHILWMAASRYTPVDSTLIPIGNLEPVKGTPFDFTVPVAIGERVNEQHQQLLYGKGYDHNFVLDAPDRKKKIAEVQGDKSGVVMGIYTTEPGLQFYGGNFMQGKNRLRTGPDDFRTAFCLETQHFPDSPNQALFPSTVLRPGQVYKSSTVYAFGIR